MESTHDERPTNIRYWVLGMFCAAAVIAYIQRATPNLLASHIQRDAGISKDQLGSVMAAFLTAYALMSLPTGWLADRWGSRRALTCFALIWSSATALMAVAWDYQAMIAIWAIAGAAQAGLFPAAIVGLRQWLPATRRAFASGMLSSSMSAGSMLSPWLGGVLVASKYNWRDVFVWVAAPGALWAFAFFSWFRDRPSQHRGTNLAEQELIAAGAGLPDQSAREAVPWLRLATNPRMWLICGQHFFRAAGQVFFVTWFASFLKESVRIPEQRAAFLAGLPPLVLIVGATLGGVVSDWLLKRTGSRRISRQALAVVNMCLCAAMFLAAAQAEGAEVRVGLICAACLWMAIGGVSSYTITMDMGGRHVATVFSTMNMCGSLGAAAFSKYIGWLIDRTQNWDYALYSMTGIYVAAAVCWTLLNPNGTLFDEKPSTSNEAA